MKTKPDTNLLHRWAALFRVAKPVLTVILSIAGAFTIFTRSAEACFVTLKSASTSVQGTIFNDRNHNGWRESGESGMPDITVQMFTAGGVLAAEQTSFADGRYSFELADNQQYYLQFSKPIGFSFSPKDKANDDAIDSDVDPYSGKTDLFSLASKEALKNIDAGIFEEPTVAWISDFRAARDATGRICIYWETGVELDIIGFNVYRSSSNYMNDEAINPELIFASTPGGFEGNAYEYKDQTAGLSTAYFYWLEVIRGSGPLMYGPVFVEAVPGVLFLSVLFQSPFAK